MNFIFQRLGLRLARFLSQPRSHYERFSVLSQAQLDDALKARRSAISRGEQPHQHGHQVSDPIHMVTCVYVCGQGSRWRGFCD